MVTPISFVRNWKTLIESISKFYLIELLIIQFSFQRMIFIRFGGFHKEPIEGFQQIEI